SWHLDVSCVDALLVMRDLRPPERTNNLRAAIHRFQHEAKPEATQHLDQAGTRNCGPARVRDGFREAALHVQPERRRDLILEDLSQTAMLRIDTAQQLALVEAASDSVISLPCSALARVFVTRHH